MCPKCEPILGPRVKKHSKEDCPLAQSAHCAFCGTSGHFSQTCQKRPKSISDSTVAIPSLNTNIPIANTYVINSPEAHIEYLKLYDIESSKRKDKNKTLVTNHLKSRGYTVVSFP